MIPFDPDLERVAPSPTTPAADDTPDDWKAEARASLGDYRARLGDLSEHGKQAFARYQQERHARRRQEERTPEWVSWMYAEAA